MMSSLSTVHSAPFLLRMNPDHAQQSLEIVANASSHHHGLSAKSGLNSKFSLSMDKCLETAEATGELRLMGRNLKAFPPNKYELRDTIVTDMSRNKLSELPNECTEFTSMEKLVLYHNTIRSIPDSIVSLQSLIFLDLSRNQLSYLPASVCQLQTLQGLILNNNRLVSLPEEIGKLQNLMELDASCNEIAHLPVQIGDLGNLRALNLRRNHLQEVPVELSYLQLTSLDLSGNRITTLPVEIRFMTTVVDLNLGENPLSCPPANICSRGRVHIYKYLEIQAIKEDRKRGVLTDLEYRRSYRKAGGGQLNDFRFANGFSADPRSKRHTADSGYGSEQPLDRRWSQEFTQDVIDMHTEDARRIVLRAANCSSASTRASPPKETNSSRSLAKAVKPVPSTGSDTSSSGYSSSMIPVVPPPASITVQTPQMSSGSTSSSVSNSGKRLNGLEDEFNKMMDGMFTSGHDRKPSNNAVPKSDSVDGVINKSDNIDRSRGDSPDDMEKEERRRAAHKLLGKQGSNRPNDLGLTSDSHKTSSSSTRTQNNTPPQPPPKAKSQLPSPRHHQPLPIPNGVSHHQKALPTPASNLPVPSSNSSSGTHSINPNSMTQQNSSKPQQQTYRQYKEHLRQQRQSESIYQQQQHVRRQQNGQQKNQVGSSETSSVKSISSSMVSTSKVSANGSTSTKTTKTSLQQYDVKTMQKEAVLSYVKSRQSATSTPSIAENEGSSRIPSKMTTSNSGLGSSSSRSSSTSSIPQPASTNGSSNSSSRSHQYMARRDMEKLATVEGHINQLRMNIESRLRITLPADLASALQDGVVLCHIANHVRPRAVPSIHVPSPAVPKLNPAKCRRNVENFLLACRKLGVREECLFTWDHVYPDLDTEALLTTLECLFEVTPATTMGDDSDSAPPEACDLGDVEFELDEDGEDENNLALTGLEEPNYPDLVPRDEPRLALLTTTAKKDPAKSKVLRNSLNPILETLMLLSILLSSILLLYLYPQEPYFYGY